MKLKIGRIPYANLFPIFYMLEKNCECSAYEFVEGVPSVLNKMLRDGELDVSPASSIEYLRNKDIYDIIEGHSISSKGAIGSIFLFSKKPIQELEGKTISITSQTDTSVALLNIILQKFFDIKCELIAHQNPNESGSDAFLLIGDDAMRHNAELKSEPNCQQYVFDLGDIWYEKTGLPFVFALWIVRKDIPEEKRTLLERFINDLNEAKASAFRSFPEIASSSPLKYFMTEHEILSYWQKIDYDLTDEHKKGFDLFGECLEALRI